MPMACAKWCHKPQPDWGRKQSVVILQQLLLLSVTLTEFRTWTRVNHRTARSLRQEFSKVNSFSLQIVDWVTGITQMSSGISFWIDFERICWLKSELEFGDKSTEIRFTSKNGQLANFSYIENTLLVPALVPLGDYRLSSQRSEWPSSPMVSPWFQMQAWEIALATNYWSLFRHSTSRLNHISQFRVFGFAGFHCINGKPSGPSHRAGYRTYT